MKRARILSTSISFFLAIVAVGSSTGQQRDKPTIASCCSVVAQALKDYSELKVGATRAEVERTFVEGSGMSFGGETVYVYKDCHFITMTVTYRPTAGDTSGAKSDIITTISKMSIGDEAKD